MSDKEWGAGEAPGRYDISPLMAGWEHRAGEVVARRIRDAGGRWKIQMRLALGLIQMEAEGRPDGERPHGFESLLERHEAKVIEHRAMHGSDDGFSLTGEECEALRDEAQTYYYRYICLFQLRDFTGVARDTARNLRALDFLRKHAPDDEEGSALEQYRPYILMMNARAKAYLSLERGNVGRAADVVRAAMEKIKACYVQLAKDAEGLDPRNLISSSAELGILNELLEEIGQVRSAITAAAASEEEASLRSLREDLRVAVQDEDFERAASLRDRIRELESRGGPA